MANLNDIWCGIIVQYNYSTWEKFAFEIVVKLISDVRFHDLFSMSFLFVLFSLFVCFFQTIAQYWPEEADFISVGPLQIEFQSTQKLDDKIIGRSFKISNTESPDQVEIKQTNLKCTQTNKQTQT